MSRAMSIHADFRSAIILRLSPLAGYRCSVNISLLKAPDGDYRQELLV
jgi:hypothetical protein